MLQSPWQGVGKFCPFQSIQSGEPAVASRLTNISAESMIAATMLADRTKLTGPCRLLQPLVSIDIHAIRVGFGAKIAALGVLGKVCWRISGRPSSNCTGAARAGVDLVDKSGGRRGPPDAPLLRQSG